MALKEGFNTAPGKIMMQGKCTPADLARIATHSRYRKIDFWNCRLPSLECLLPLKKLESYCQYGGTVSDYSALAQVPTLAELFLNSINGYGDLSFVKPLVQIKSLHLLYLNKLEAFPDLAGHTSLKHVFLWNCKRLADISALTKIPHLETLDFVDTPQGPDELEFLLKPDNIRRVNATFGTVKANKRMDDMLRHYGKSKHEE